MLYTSHINATASHAPNQGAAFAQPETGELDFLQNLLGLKAMEISDSPEQQLSSASPLVKSPLQNAGGAEDSLLSELDRKERTAWNSIFPGLSPTALNTVIQQAKGQKPTDGTSTEIDIILRRWEMGKPVSDLPTSSKTVSQNGTPQKAEVVQTEANKVGITPNDFQLAMDKQNIDLKKSDSAKPVSMKNANGEQPNALKSDPSQENVAQKYAKALFDSQGSNKAKGENSRLETLLSQNQLPDGKSTVANQVSQSANVKNTNTPAPQAGDEASKLAEGSSRKGRNLAKVDLNPSEMSGLHAKTQSAVLPGGANAIRTESHATVPELMTKVETLAHKGGGKMTVSLNPPHLGSIEVQVTTKGKNVEVEMLSSSTEAKSILQSKLQELKSALHAHDLTLTKVEVSVARDVNPKPYAAYSDQTNSQGQSQSESQAFYSNEKQQQQQQQQASSGQFYARGSQLVSNSGPTLAGRSQSQHTGNVDLRI